MRLWTGTSACEYRDVQRTPVELSDRYAPPEYHKHKYYDAKQLDMWSIGIVVYILLAASHPFEDNSLAVTIENIKSCTPSIERIRRVNADVSKFAIDLVEGTLKYPPQDRLTARAAVNLAKRVRIQP
ncbi:kinase-like protein [Fomitiporia mediterranea MF3/22]|uniref:kinase-like protein n=1 Tax=Fomitiporia mediterranea (strain MF3/22) TaxID=694068 RepID=UPI0004407B8A|nr:kinase-like protein [Fomitiporia mediterranea MF3/22]EJC99378.1 kinase-like protein [Fomitiporia mediterranea MF3/22]